RQGNILKNKSQIVSAAYSEEFQTAKEITEQLAKSYQIVFSLEEIEQLAILFIGLKKESQALSEEKQLNRIVDDRIITALKKVLADVEKTYLIQFDDEQFFAKLAIHFQSLYDRSQYEAFTRNSGLLDIKTTYPLIFDIAVYISSAMQESLNFWF